MRNENLPAVTEKRSIVPEKVSDGKVITNKTIALLSFASSPIVIQIIKTLANVTLKWLSERHSSNQNLITTRIANQGRGFKNLCNGFGGGRRIRRRKGS